MKEVIGSILPLAIAVTISPIPIIAEILLLFTKKPVANAASYLAGFIVGVAGVLAIPVAIAATINLSAGSGPSTGASILQLALGALLLVAALRQFRGRPKPGEQAAMPKWMNGIAGFAPGKSLIVGVGIGALNPKNIIVGAAAAVAIASASLSAGQVTGAIAVYVLIAVLGVAAPLAVTLAMGEKAQKILDSWKAWLGQNNAVVMTVLFLIFAVVLIGKASQESRDEHRKTIANLVGLTDGVPWTPRRSRQFSSSTSRTRTRHRRLGPRWPRYSVAAAVT